VSPYFIRDSLLNKCQELGIQVIAYSPFGGDLVQKSGPLHNETVAGLRILFHVTGIAKSHNKSPAQVILKWLLQRGCAVIPKTVSKDRLIENQRGVMDSFSLTAAQMEAIAGLNTGKSVVNILQYWGIDVWQ